MARRPTRHVAGPPQAAGPAWGQFVPRAEFTCEATGSVYLADTAYTIRNGNRALLARARKWAKAGKVALALTGAAPKG